jgi:hypothetical protein
MKCSQCSFFNGYDCDQLPGELEDPICLQRAQLYSNLRMERRLQGLERSLVSFSPPTLPKELHQKMQRYIEQALSEMEEGDQWKFPPLDDEGEP